MTSLLLRQTFLYITRQFMQVKLCVVVKRSIILQSNKEDFLRIDVNIQLSTTYPCSHIHAQIIQSYKRQALKFI